MATCIELVWYRPEGGPNRYETECGNFRVTEKAGIGWVPEVNDGHGKWAGINVPVQYPGLEDALRVCEELCADSGDAFIDSNAITILEGHQYESGAAPGDVAVPEKEARAIVARLGAPLAAQSTVKRVQTKLRTVRQWADLSDQALLTQGQRELLAQIIAGLDGGHDVTVV